VTRQLFEYHPIIGYRFVPGLKARVPHEGGGYLVRVNQQGFRCDHEFQKRRRPGVRRILLFGDSYTAGDGVSNGQRYGDLLEKYIPGVEVFNFGLSGTGTDQHFLIYEEFAAEVEHDLMIVAVLVENIRRIACRYRPYQNELGEEVWYAKPYFELCQGRPVLKGVPVSKQPLRESDLTDKQRNELYISGRFEWLRNIVKGIGLRDAAQRITHFQPLPEYNDPENPLWLLLSAILREWIFKHPAKVALFLIPLNQYVDETSDPSQYEARFEELCGSLGCVLHNPLPDLLKYDQRARRQFRFSTDIHPSPLGHEALARSLIPTVRNLLEGRS
jgi:lysophospholipase L1-like esterase